MKITVKSAAVLTAGATAALVLGVASPAVSDDPFTHVVPGSYQVIDADDGAVGVVAECPAGEEIVAGNYTMYEYTPYGIETLHNAPAPSISRAIKESPDYWEWEFDPEVDVTLEVDAVCTSM